MWERHAWNNAVQIRTALHEHRPLLSLEFFVFITPKDGNIYKNRGGREVRIHKSVLHSRTPLMSQKRLGWVLHKLTTTVRTIVGGRIDEHDRDDGLILGQLSVSSGDTRHHAHEKKKLKISRNTTRLERYLDRFDTFRMPLPGIEIPSDQPTQKLSFDQEGTTASAVFVRGIANNEKVRSLR